MKPATAALIKDEIDHLDKEIKYMRESIVAWEKHLKNGKEKLEKLLTQRTELEIDLQDG